MNVCLADRPSETAVDHPALLRCCRLLAESAGWGTLVLSLDLAQTLSPDGSDTLSSVIRKARAAGFQTIIRRQPVDTLTQLVPELPLVVETGKRQFSVITDITQQSPQQDFTVTLHTPAANDSWLNTKIAAEQFLQSWSGSGMRFTPINTALTCFSLIAREHKLDLTTERLRHEFRLTNEEIPPAALLRMCKTVGLKAQSLKLDFDKLSRLGKAFPAMARLRNGRHVVVTGFAPAPDAIEEKRIGLYDPLEGTTGGHRRLSKEAFSDIWDGEVFLFKRQYGLTDANQPFGLRWFLPEILRQRTAFLDVGLAVLFINAIALVTPIFFQLVIDKVLVNQAFTTLHVLGIGMTVMLVVNACLDYLRDYILLHATNKIDLRVTARTFRHMLNLPLDFFEKVTAGVLTKHMQQTANIRSFLTGSVFLTLLEATSLFVFLPFLFFYSPSLTGIVATFTTAIALVILLLIAPFKRRLNALYDAEGNRQAMLVETINGIPTVKAMAIEPLLRNLWEEKVAKAISMQFRVGKISITAKAVTQLLERLMTVALIWFGASQVFSGTLTVGALIAFQMLAGRVTSPLVRLVGLIHQYQEAALSVEKLGGVMNAKPEWGTDRHGARPPLTGNIVFDRVSFRYGPDIPDTLRQLSFVIPAGTTLGIVGPSGSGKTTLTRMLQKAYFPSTGTIRISSCYLNELDTAHLRRNMGVVLQESFLFRATVADNIRAGQSSATRQQIIEAAIMAGADEFIVNLPQGYDTLLEEGASNLSGGQRQRLAIARALLTSPEILILDEATSSLDPESESIVRKNLRRIAQGRTLLMVSHRLSMIKGADNILVLDRGTVVGFGPHEQLMQSCPLYTQLWRQQMEL